MAISYIDQILIIKADYLLHYHIKYEQLILQFLVGLIYFKQVYPQHQKQLNANRLNHIIFISMNLNLIVLSLLIALSYTNTYTTNLNTNQILISNASTSQKVNITFATPPNINTITIASIDKQNKQVFVASKKLQYLSLTLNSTNSSSLSTNFEIGSFNRTSKTSVFETFKKTENGDWSVIKTTKESLSCSLVYNKDTNKYGFLKFANREITFYQPSNLNINDTSTITIKENCYFYQETSLYTVNNQSFTLIPKPFLNWASSSSPEESITYGYLGNVIYRFNYITNRFVNVYSLPNVYHIIFHIKSYLNRVLVVTASSQFNQTSNTSDITQTFWAFSNTPSFIFLSSFFIVGRTSNNVPILPYFVSPSLNRLLVVYTATDGTTTSAAKFINYSNTNAFSNISLPSEISATALSSLDITKDCYFGDSYFITRNSTIEEAYQFIGLKAIFLRSRTTNQTNHTMTHVDLSNKNQLVVLNAFNNSLVIQIEQSTYGNLPSIFKINSSANCPYGCKNCQNGTCQECLSKFILETSSNVCFRCGQNCAACDFSNIDRCTSCSQGSYISGSACLPCDQSCIACEVSPKKCTTCAPSKILQNDTCVSCPRNCMICSSSTQCSSCSKGFVLRNGICNGCAISCSNCSATIISACIFCEKGFFFLNSACNSCPDNCLACDNNSTCKECSPGYILNSTKKTCVKACSISCATCMDNQPSLCLSCFEKVNVTNGKCVLNTTCTADNTCANCGQMLGYVLAGSTCIQCEAIDNCLQCSITQASACFICADGYYVNSSSLCQSCPVGCNNCSSINICTVCSIGYTLPYGYTSGQCIQCKSPCQTCIDFDSYCLTCTSGYSKKGWKCQRNAYCSFKFTLKDNMTSVGELDNITTSLLSILNQNTTNVQIITYSSITFSSTIIEGSATTSNPTLSASLLTSALYSGKLVISSANYTVVSASVGVVGAENSPQPSKLPLIIGLSVGLGGFLILMASIVIWCKIKNRRYIRYKEQKF